jgi:hypothetical protein
MRGVVMTAQSNSERQKRHKIKKTKAGICFWGGCNVYTGGGLCNEHLALQGIYNKRWYEKRKAKVNDEK